MDKTISFYDTASESFYHGMILGLISMMDNQYKIKSNRESGKGRFDIGLIPRDDKGLSTLRRQSAACFLSAS